VTFQEFSSKKVFGVPILYLIGAAVAVLVVVAWKMKPSAPDAAEEEVPVDAADVDQETKDPYDGFETQGTVTVVQQPAPSTADNANASISNNATWVSRGIQFLGAQHSVPGTTAQAALTKYLADADRSFEEEKYVNMVITELGPPPDLEGGGGSVAGEKLQKQFTTAPGVHSVKNLGDQSYSSLAALYYGRTDADAISLIQAKNPTLGPNGPWPVGTKVNIPVFAQPKVYKVPPGKGETAKVIAAKNGIVGTQAMVILGRWNNANESSMNPEKVFKPGSYLKVGPI
jgi:hypothetical protein